MEKLIFQDRKTPIEIFCKEKYINYYIRGQIFEFSDNHVEGNKYGKAFYRLIVLVLVNDKYQEGIVENCWDYKTSISFVFLGQTKKEFLDMQNSRIVLMAEHQERNRKKRQEWIKEIKKTTNAPIIIDKKEVNIKETNYLNDAMKSNKNIILLSMNLCLDRIESREDRSLMPHNNRIFPLLSCFYTPDEYYEPVVFSKLFEDVSFYLDYNHLTKTKYYKILRDITWLCNKWSSFEEISEDLNEFNQNIQDREYPLTDFCYTFFDDRIDELITKKQITQCQHLKCKKFFPYKEGKKYCSPKCKKNAESARDYEKHKDKRRAKSRESTRKDRACYKEKGAKK